ncbi:M50 family metallopeptidase [Glycomyces tritici]|uniref:M50 family metallopeptidase n=1 Tax=Glycomyces tritici TaxID=2665176 RepID=A0ABT7YVV3_9ACTN|nr:M50 family metallopeptidase [Glycomyces tritici]MDN3242745.1 M50 family metallopeptidase [Glycomyces tritici]
MEPIETVIDTLAQTQDAPPVWVMLACLAAAAAAVLYTPVWRWTRGLVTIAHEGGHALMAILMRRRLTGIRLHADTSGLTFSRGRPTGFGAAMTLFAGYIAPALLGLLAAALTGAGRIVLLLWITLGLLAVMLVFIRNWYGALALIVVGAGVFAATWYGNAIVQTVAAYAGSWLLLLGSVKPVLELGSRRRRRRHGAGQSDADQLAGITAMPTGGWIFLFALVTIASALWGTSMLLPVDDWVNA